MSYGWEKCIELSHPNDCFPIKIKMNDINLTGLIDYNAAFSGIKTSVFMTLGTARMMSAKFKCKNKTIPSHGIF